MVHLIYTLSASGDQHIGVLMRSIDDFVQAHHNYTPHNTFWDSFSNTIDETTSTDGAYQGEALFRTDVWEHNPGDYVRDPVLHEKDEWDRGKIYYEYGWGNQLTDEEQQATTLISHCPRHDHRHGKNYPTHPAMVKWVLKIRHITDWSNKEQDDLNKFISKIITDENLGYKEADEYTDKQVADWMSQVDYAEHCRMLKTSQINGQSHKDAWICRICKQCYVANADWQESGKDFGNNPEPLYHHSQKVCESCNHNFVMSARFGADRHEFIFPCGQFISPFWYPKPPGERMPVQCPDGDDRGTFFTAIEGPREVREPTPDMKRAWAEDVHNCDKALISKLQELLEETRERASNGGGIGITREQFSRDMKNAREDALNECADKVLKAEQDLAESRNLMDIVAQEKQEIKQNAEACRQSLAKVKQMNAPQGQKIETLKKEIVNRDSVIAEQKEKLAFIDALPPKAKFRMVMAEFSSYRGHARQSLKTTDTWMFDLPTGESSSIGMKWAIEDYQRVAEDIKKAEQKKKEQQMKNQRKKKQVEMLACAYCEKSCHKKSMVEKWGDMVCRQCAK